MSFDPLPSDLEIGIERFAIEHHLSRDEALRQVVAPGLVAASEPAKSKIRIPGLPSLPMSPEDSLVVDEAMAIVMEARRERSARVSGA